MVDSWETTLSGSSVQYKRGYKFGYENIRGASRAVTDKQISILMDLCEKNDYSIEWDLGRLDALIDYKWELN